MWFACSSSPPCQVHVLNAKPFDVVKIKHAHWLQIVQFFGAVLEDKALLLITEYMPRGSLYDAMASDTREQLRWHRRFRPQTNCVFPYVSPYSRQVGHFLGRSTLHGHPCCCHISPADLVCVPGLLIHIACMTFRGII